MENNNEVLLRVEHLCQYFKMGRKELKAVDDVSFEIKKGEVFGLVGESGCGKTTTGRSIIRLYDITSGNIYFKGQRICAGTRSYTDAIAAAKRETLKAVGALRAESKADPSRAAENDKRIAEKRAELQGIIAENRRKIREAKLDHTTSDRQYAEAQVKRVDEEYAPKLEAAKGDPEKFAAVKKEYSRDRHIAKHTKLITQIQMIFQDPIASLNPRMTVREIVSEGLVINGIKDKKYIEEKVYEILELVGLVREHAGRYPHEFSGGQRRRTHFGARRVHSGAGDQSAQRAAREVGPDHFVYRARSVRRQIFFGQNRRHVFRKNGGACLVGRIVCAPAPPLYPFPVVRDSASRPALRKEAHEDYL